MSGNTLVRRYRHVIWDWNGTLLDDTAVVIETMNELLARRALPLLDDERYRDVFTFPVERYYEALGFDLVAEPFAQLAVEWVAGFEARWHTAAVRDGALPVLDALEAAEVASSVLSAAEEDLLHRQAAHFGIAHRFVRLSGIADHHAVSKVARGRECIELLDTPRAEVLLVGDTAHDVEVGRELGVDVVLVAGGHQSRMRLEETGAPVLDCLEDLVDFARSYSFRTRTAVP